MKEETSGVSGCSLGGDPQHGRARRRIILYCVECAIRFLQRKDLHVLLDRNFRSLPVGSPLHLARIVCHATDYTLIREERYGGVHD